MNIKKIAIIALSATMLLSGCGNNKNIDDENVEFGDIDTTKEYVDDSSYQAPSLVDRKQEVDINDYFIKVPIEITQEITSGQLTALDGRKYNIQRIQLNGVYFDINEIAISNNYRMGISNGVLQITIPNEEGKRPIIASVAQIADGETDTLEYMDIMQLDDIINEYMGIYEEEPHQFSSEYGYYYTYDKYVDWLNEHEYVKKSIDVYSPEQILKLAFDVFDLDYNIDDFTYNISMNNFEYSDWYIIKGFFKYEMEDGLIIDISVKKSSEGVFLLMTSYEDDANLDMDGNIYFTPTMIINIAQDNYYEIGETYNDYIARFNYEKGNY